MAAQAIPAFSVSSSLESVVARGHWLRHPGQLASLVPRMLLWREGELPPVSQCTCHYCKVHFRREKCDRAGFLGYEKVAVGMVTSLTCNKLFNVELTSKISFRIPDQFHTNSRGICPFRLNLRHSQTSLNKSSPFFRLYIQICPNICMGSVLDASTPIPETMDSGDAFSR